MYKPLNEGYADVTPDLAYIVGVVKASITAGSVAHVGVVPPSEIVAVERVTKRPKQTIMFLSEPYDVKLDPKEFFVNRHVHVRDHRRQA